jgi:hypothetical protein
MPKEGEMRRRRSNEMNDISQNISTLSMDAVLDRTLNLEKHMF